jgi:iron transport multicopper oxidase
MTIIEADGVNTQPLTVDSLQIFAAQRYSLIVHAKEKGGNFWIRAEPRAGPDGGPSGFAGGISSAILRYAGARKVDPTTTQTLSVIPLMEGNLHPLINPRAPGQPYPGGADVLFDLNINITDQGRFTINNVSFTPPSVPVLLQILSGSTQASQLLPKGSVFPLPPNKVVEISIPALGAAAGPVSTVLLLYLPTNNTDPHSYSILSTSTE